MSRHTWIPAPVVAVLCASLTACGGGGEGAALTEPEARAIAAASVDTATRAHNETFLRMGGKKRDEAGLTVRGTPANFTIGGGIEQGADGGRVAVSGSGGALGDGYQVDLTTTYAAWRVPTADGDLTIDGGLTLHFAITKALPPELDLTLAGDLEVTREAGAAASLQVDLRARVGGGGATLCGAIGGHSLDADGC